MTQKDGCECKVSLQNQTKIYTVYVRNYDLRTSAAPQQETCGLAIDINYANPKNYPENKDSVECMKGTNTRSVSLLQNGVLNFTSRIVGGNFARGNTNTSTLTSYDNVRLIINCSLPNIQTKQQDKTISSNMQTTRHMTDTAIQDDTDMTVASNMQTTGQMADAGIGDKTVSDTDSTLYIAIGVCSAVVLVAFFVVVAIIIIRRKGNKYNDDIEVQPDIDSNDDDSDGLKYNCLYNTSEQNIMEGNYHTVDIESKQNPGIQNFDSNYSTVDGHYSSVDIVNVPTADVSKTDNTIESTTNKTPRSVIQQTEEEINNVKHVTLTTGVNVEYAVVD